MYERFEWRYSDAMRALFSYPHRKALSIAILDGLQGAALLLIWPLAAFIILGQSFFSLGVVLAVTFLTAFLGRFWVRRALRAVRVDRSPYVLATIAFSSWIFRLAAGTPVQIVVADIYYHAAAQPRGRGVDVHAHDQWADNGHYVDEYTTLKEMGLSIGRIVLCLTFALACVVWHPLIAFAVSMAIAGIAAAASVILSHRLQRGVF
jgi:hypothetical protein